MSNELDATIIRSLAELNSASQRLDALSQEVGLVVDAEIRAWIDDNDWAGEAKYHSDDRGDTWLALRDWMMPGDENQDAYLYFQLTYTSEQPEDVWYLVSYTGSGVARMGFKLYSNAARPNALAKLFRGSKEMEGLPLDGADFFLPIQLDREALATAVENDALYEAMEPLRKTLDRLPQIASQLEPLHRAIVAVAK